MAASAHAHPTYRFPNRRRLRAFAFDPSLRIDLDAAVINQITLPVPWEELAPGPVGEYLEVVDVDPASNACYAPVDLDHPALLAQDGLAPSEAVPQFHQQMVYAVAMTTIRNFEQALGRRALWAVRTDSPGAEDAWGYVEKLRIYPHALREANAYYSPAKKALLFGYFPAVGGGDNLPGGTVFTCLSHDIVAHETTHALLDGLHRRFIEPSNPDVLAFHEAFADMVALFQHFSFPEVLRHQIAKTRGDLGKQNLLAELAQQFGRALGNRGALRNALSTPPDEAVATLERTHEPHDRGAILVAAVFDAFLAIYRRRIADLVRIATGGSGVLPEGDIHPDLVHRMADEAAKTSGHFLRILIRALDYCPPVDVGFGDYLRAMITADRDLVPEDPYGYRVALVAAFRRRGIQPDGVRSLAEENLLWQPPPSEDAEKLREAAFSKVHILRELCPDWGFGKDRRQAFEQSREFGSMLNGWLNVKPEHRQVVECLGLTLDPEAPGTITRSKEYKGVPALEVHSVRPAHRVRPDGTTKTDLVVELTQKRFGFLAPEHQAHHDGKKRPPKRFDFVFRGGCTVLVDLESGEVRYAIGKSVTSERRLAAQRAFLSGSRGASLAATYFGTPERSFYARASGGRREPLALVHRSLPDEERSP
jgi:hypothetical protein